MALWTENDDKAKAEKPVREPAKADPAPPAPAPAAEDTGKWGDGVVSQEERAALIAEYEGAPEDWQRAAAGEKVTFTSEPDYVWTGGTQDQPVPPEVAEQQQEDPPTQ